MSIKKICDAVAANHQLPLYMKQATFVKMNPEKRGPVEFTVSEGYQTIQHLYENYYKPIEYHETSV